MMRPSFLPKRFAFKGSRWLWLLALLPLWETLRIVGDVNPLLMPPLQEIARALIGGLLRGSLGFRWFISVVLVISGLAVGAIGALIFAALASIGNRIRSFFSVMASMLHPLPGLAILPLVILWMGTGTEAILFIIVHAVLWPIFINMDSGIRSLASPWMSYARNLSLTRKTIFLRIVLPGSFPHLISGMRTGWARAWRAFIAAEMVFGAVGMTGGLGWQLFESRVMMDSANLYAGIVIVMITGIVVEEGILTQWENRVRKRWGEVL